MSDNNQVTDRHPDDIDVPLLPSVDNNDATLDDYNIPINTGIICPESTTDEQKFPIGQVSAISVAIISNYISMQIVYPFIPFMVHSFFPDLDSKELGYKAGWMGSAYSIGACIGSIAWGYIADLFGRKFVLIYGIIGTLLTSLFFGFSINYAWAISARVLWGLLNGNAGVAKAYLAEICSDKNTPKALSTVGLMDGLARVIGPFLGGFLGDNTNYQQIVDKMPIFGTFPYLFPCVVCAFLCLIGYIVTQCSVTESLSIEKQREFRRNLFNFKQSNKNENLWSILSRRDIAMSITLYFLASLHCGGLDEVIPLYLLNKPEDGGFSYKSDNIGFMYLFAGPFQMIGLLVFYPLWVKWFGIVNGCKYNAILVVIVTILLPSISFGNHLSLVGSYLLISPFFGILLALRVMIFTSGMALVNNSCNMAQRSRVNGVSQGIGSVARIIGPALFGSLFAAFVSSSLPSPLNYWMIFIILGIPHLVIFIMTFFMSESLNHKKIELNENSNENNESSVKDIELDISQQIIDQKLENVTSDKNINNSPITNTNTITNIMDNNINDINKSK